MDKRLKIGMGFHTSSNCFCDGIGDYLSNLAAGGNVITAKSVDSSSSLMDFQREMINGAEGYGVYRFIIGDDSPPYGAPVFTLAQNYLKYVQENWPPELDKSLFHVEVMNEVSQDESDWLGKLLYELSIMFMNNGFNFCGPGWGPGQPEPHNWRTPGMLKFLRLCSQNPDHLAISTHEYAYDNTMESQIPWQMGRIIDMNAACIENGFSPPNVMITEFGWSYQTAPSWQDGIPQIIGMLDWYLENAPNVVAIPGLWALDKDSKWGRIAETINPYMTPLVNIINTRDWPQPDTPGLPPVEPEEKPKIVILKLAQGHGETTWTLAGAYAHNNYKRTITASHDDLLTMLRAGNPDSYAIIADPDRPSQKEAIELLVAEGFKYEVMYIEDTPMPPTTDIFKYRPCDTTRITQYFAANPNYYEQFGLPGHEGIDLGVALGLPYYAVQDGIVEWASDKNGVGTPSHYGWHVYIRHNIDDLQFHTLYAHAQPDLPVKVGDMVQAGQIVGYSGNTGTSTGPHIHFGLLWPTDTGNGYPMWRFGQCVDPLPYIEGKGVPPTPAVGTEYDLLTYLVGDGRLYEVYNVDGGNERLQSQSKGSGEYWQTKNARAEQFFLINGMMHRGWDTSPGGGRFYQQQAYTGTVSAPWLPRFMKAGESFTVSLWVQFYTWDCEKSALNSGQVTDTRKFIWHYDTWESRWGVQLNDVIEIRWLNGGETYFYSKRFGLVGWERTHQDPDTPEWSSIREIHEPGQRPDNVVVLPTCLA